MTTTHCLMCESVIADTGDYFARCPNTRCGAMVALGEWYVPLKMYADRCGEIARLWSQVLELKEG